MKNNVPPDCFGYQGETMLYGKTAEGCLDCTLFDPCHKITVASTLQALSGNLDLIVQNGLAAGRLQPYDELGGSRDVDTGQLIDT